jgi:taurine--2-oxoglutarate transaminase
MALVESGDRVRADDARYVLHSWSVRSAIDPIPIAGAEGRYFWDYDGKRYLDFASQLVNVSLGHQQPKVVAAIKEQADRLCTIGPMMANE